MKKQRKALQAPNVIVFIFLVMVIMMILTWIVPAGAYDRYFNEELNRTLIDPDSYHAVAQSPVGIMAMLQSISSGFIRNISTIAYVFCWGGAFGILMKTKLIDDGIKSVIGGNRRMKAPFLIIVFISFLFSAGGAFVGIQQSFWAFTPVIAVLCASIGYDELVAFVAVAVANNIGYMCGPMNMWNTGVAQQISELPLFSGVRMRLALWVLFMTMLLVYTWLYARRIQKDPARSVTYGLEKKSLQLSEEMGERAELTPRRKVALACLIAEFVVFIILIAFFDMTSSGKIGAYLLGTGIIVAVVNGNDYNKIADGFVEGFQMVLVPCIVLGMAGSIMEILESGNTLDPILHGAVQLLSGTSNTFALLMIYLFQFLFNFLVPSGTAQAATTMPIIAPLADLVNVSRQSAILAFQFGDGYSNMIWPTALLAPLAFTNIPLKKWLKWFLPFTAVFIVVSCLVLVYASMTGF